MPVPPTVMPETDWKVPATAAGEAASRNLEALYGHYRNGIPDNLLVDATRSPTNVTLHINGRQRTVAAGATVEVRAREVGRMLAYTITPVSALTEAAQVVVYERRVGSGGVA